LPAGKPRQFVRRTLTQTGTVDNIAKITTGEAKAVILTLDPKPAAAPDAMNMPKSYLNVVLKKSSKPIKTVLNEGKTVQGIGNAYVDEILYVAGISPFSKADKIPDQKIEDLTKAIRNFLTDAENHILKNFPDTITKRHATSCRCTAPKKNKPCPANPSMSSRSTNERLTTLTASNYLTKFQSTSTPRKHLAALMTKVGSSISSLRIINE
jgi:formamidopyrimidine-DNA glycosylase